MVESLAAGAGAAPGLAGGIVSRPALFGRLRTAARITEVCAPPGSGKTVLLRSWISESNLAQCGAWMTVRSEERDPQRFWIAVADALRGTAPAAALIRPLSPAPDLDGWTVVERLLKDLATLKDRIWLVIDDAHELRSPETRHQLELFLLRAPSELRLLLATRDDLLLGLHRLRLEGQLSEIRADDLRFSPDEARALMTMAAVELSDETLALLYRRTEGWAAGLRLAALSLAGHPAPEYFAAEFSGTEQVVAEYLLAEVLDRQPGHVRQLLLRTSVLERVNGELADLLTSRSGGERILQDLERASAFVVSLDLARSWFRYHRLFADMLQLELSRTEPAEVPALHHAAAEWFAAHGHPVDAIRHAQAAEDWGLAARLLADHWFGLVLDGQAATANDLLTGFPRRADAADAELTTLMAAGELNAGSLDEAEQYLALATAGMATVPADRRGHLQAMLAILRLWLARQRGDLPAAVTEAQRLLALAELPDAAALSPGEIAPADPAGLDDDLRALAMVNLGVAERFSMRLDQAERHLARGVALARQAGRP